MTFCVTLNRLVEEFGSRRLVRRMIAAGWITAVRRGGPGRESLYDYQSAEAAYERFKVGEEPPLMPSELKQKAA